MQEEGSNIPVFMKNMYFNIKLFLIFLPLCQFQHKSKHSYTKTSDSHYYISSFKVNGNEISWRNKNWKNVSYDSTVGKYVSGEYVVGADDDVTIDVEFAVYSFSISVDASSINGETMLTVAGSTQTRDRINYGETLVIGMKSDEGYHIESVYINGMDAGYVPYSDNPNDNVFNNSEFV